MNKVQVLRPNEVLQQDAQRKFSDAVQNIAFQLTLSRRMIGMLQVARDGLWVFGDGLDETDKERCARRDLAKSMYQSANGVDNWIPLFHSLEKRGLVFRPARVDEGRDGKHGEFWAKHKNDYKVIELTQAGELVCGLLVLAGLMPARQVEQKKLKKKG